jgi:hypothetical protein
MDREQQVYDKSVTRVQRRCNGQAKISLKVQFQKKRVVLFCDWREREREREENKLVKNKSSLTGKWIHSASNFC